MRKMRKSFCKVLNRISEMIELLISCHPQGFGILLGENEPPTSHEIHEMMNALRDKMPEDYKSVMPVLETEAERIVFDSEYFAKSVELAGGWPHIHLVSQEYRDTDSRMWSVVMDHVKFVGKSHTRHMSKLGYIAVHYGLSPNTVMKYHREFSERLAGMLLVPSGDYDDFYI